MNKDLIEIIVVLDKSGSMDEIKHDTIGGFNSFIDKQREEDGDANVTLVLFDDKYNVMYEGVDINDVRKLDTSNYVPSDLTALLDAMGKAINVTSARLDGLKKTDYPGKVMFVVITDGKENKSKEFTHAQVMKKVEQCKKDGWEFIFLGCEEDQIKQGNTLKIDVNVKYDKNAHGVHAMYNSLNTTASTYRKTGDLKWTEDPTKN